MRRCIGLDVHREFAQVVIWEDGVVWQAGRIQTTPEALRLFADSLCATDEVALEATGNTYAIARRWSATWGGWWSPIRRRLGRSPRPRSRPTRSTRRCWRGCWRPTTCPRCGCLMTKRTRCAVRSPAAPTSCGSGPGRRNQVQSILHRNLIGRCPAADLFGNKGRAWLATQDLPPRRAPGGRGAGAPTRLPRPGAAHRRRRTRPGRPPARRGPPAADHPRGGRHRGPGDRGRGR
jgi:hypothetical protein